MDAGNTKRSSYKGHAPAEAHWASIADRICEVLDMIYVRKRKSFVKFAKDRAITSEQLAAAAIAEMIREDLRERSV